MIKIILVLAFMAQVSFNLEPVNGIDDKQKAKDVILFLVKLGADAEAIQARTSHLDQQKVAEAITELKAENKIKDKTSNSEPISK